MTLADGGQVLYDYDPGNAAYALATLGGALLAVLLGTAAVRR